MQACGSLPLSARVRNASSLGQRRNVKCNSPASYGERMQCGGNPVLRIGRTGGEAIRLGRKDGISSDDTFELRRCRLRTAAAPRVRRDLQARMEGQLLQNVVDVPLHRIGGEVETLPDRSVAQPVRDQIARGPLSRGHADGLGNLRRLAAERELRNVREERARERRWK